MPEEGVSLPGVKDAIGNATLIAGKMVVPTIEQQYASRNSAYAALRPRLADERDGVAAPVQVSGRSRQTAPPNHSGRSSDLFLSMNAWR